jgi:hypothetical protein
VSTDEKVPLVEVDGLHAVLAAENWFAENGYCSKTQFVFEPIKVPICRKLPE